jgi:Methyltransferase domain
MEQTSPPRESANDAAYAELYGKLRDALLTVSMQEKRLAVLTRKLQPPRAAGVPEAVSKIAMLALPEKVDDGTATEANPARTDSPIRLRSNRDQAAQDRIESLWKNFPPGTEGAISRADEDFLNAMIDRVRPDRVYEIGVASGTSSAFILNSMSAYADPSQVWLHSYDLAEMCYYSPADPVGVATHRMVPELLEHWNLQLKKTVLDVPREKETRTLYFIDANHLHPAPTLDLVSLLGRLQPGDYVIFHDINLPRLMDGKYPDTGAQWLFDDWPGPRFASAEPIPNIGAIMIPEDKGLIRTFLTTSLSRPWADPSPGGPEFLEACEQRLMEFLADI